MGRFVCWSMVLGCLAGATGMVRMAANAIPGQLSTEPGVIDLGLVDQGTQHPLDFALRNDTRGIVWLDEVRPSCSCGKVAMPKDRLFPGESTVVSGLWNIGAARHQIVAQFALLYRLADGTHYVKFLEAKADAVPDIEIEPRSLTFRRGANAAAAVHYRPRSGRTYRVAAAVSPCEAVSVRHMAEDGVIHVAFETNLWPEANSDTVLITLQTDSPNEPTIHIPVKVTGEMRSDSMSSGG